MQLLPIQLHPKSKKVKAKAKASHRLISRPDWFINTSFFFSSLFIPLSSLIIVDHLLEKMPSFTIFRENRFYICVVAALSITIMLFTVLHLRNAIPSRQSYEVHGHGELGCNSFYASDLVTCISDNSGWKEGGMKDLASVGKSGLRGKRWALGCLLGILESETSCGCWLERGERGRERCAERLVLLQLFTHLWDSWTVESENPSRSTKRIILLRQRQCSLTLGSMRKIRVSSTYDCDMFQVCLVFTLRKYHSNQSYRPVNVLALPNTIHSNSKEASHSSQYANNLTIPQSMVHQ